MGNPLSRESTEHLDTIPKCVQFWANHTPDREMFVFYNGDVRRPYTFKQVFENAGKFAHRLRYEYGFQKGDIIVNTIPNSPERMYTEVGIALAGCICLNCSIVFADGSDFLTAARNVCCNAVIMSAEGNSPAWRLLANSVKGDTSSSVVSLDCDKVPTMKSAILVSRQPLGNRKNFVQDLEDSKENMYVDPSVQPDDILYAFSTSGSTGYSKIVPHSHDDMIYTRNTTSEIIQQQSRQSWNSPIYYNDRPFGWAGGYSVSTYASGETRILLDVYDTIGSKVGADVWKIIYQEKVDYAAILPLDLDHMLKHTIYKGDYKLKMVLTGGQPMRKNQFLNYLKVAHEVAVGYGSTETLAITISIVKEFKDYFCGQVIPGKEVRVVDEEGKECKTGQRGTIHFRGKAMFKGYLNRLEDPDPKTLMVFTKDGWLNLDDTGFFDQDKNLYVLGRLKDVISYGATFLHPGWLEPKIEQHPQVETACVLPVSDPVLFQNICAVVKQVPGSDLKEEQLRTFCQKLFLQGKEIEATPVPEYYLILDDFPKTSTGKVDRQSLQKIAEEKFGSK